MARVWIVYTPNILADLFEKLLSSLNSVKVVPHPFGDIDVIVLPLDEFGRPDIGLLPYPTPPAKLVAVSPRADRALVRLPHEEAWEEISPFHLDDLLTEVLAGKGRPTYPPTRTQPSLADALRQAWQRAVAGLAGALPQPRRLNPWFAALVASVAALFYLSLGTLAAAESSLPGDPLYGVKRLTETAQLALAPGSHQQILNVEFAERRLEEIEVLAAKGVVIPTLIEDMADSTAAAVVSTAPEARNAVVLVQLAELTQRQQEVLRTVQPRVPDADTQEAVEHALAVSESSHSQAVAALNRQPSTPSGTPPSTQVAAAAPAETGSPTPTKPPPVATSTFTPAPTNTLIPPTATATPWPTATRTDVPTKTPTSPAVPSRIPPGEPDTATPAPLPSATATITQTATATSTSTATATATTSATPLPTKTPTGTPTPTDVPTATPTDTPLPSETPAPTDTPLPTATNTPTPTTTPDATVTEEVVTPTPSPTDPVPPAIIEPTPTPGWPDELRPTPLPTGGPRGSFGIDGYAA